MTPRFASTRVLAAVCSVGCLATAADAAGHGNTLVTYIDTIQEYDETGTLVQSIQVPYPGTGTSEAPRDHVVDPNGDIYVYNGTFAPYLSVYRAATGSWEHFTNATWATSNNTSYGGIAVLGDHAFVTDNLNADGIYRFDTTDGSSVLFGQQFFGYNDLTIGRDGLLYALVNETVLEVFDPQTLAGVGQVVLGKAVRGVAVAADGQIYGASWDGNLYRFAPDGTVTATLNGGQGSLADIDIDPCGNLVAASRFNDVLVTDTSLSAISTTFFGGDFVSFAAPEKALVQGAEVVRVGMPANAHTLLPDPAQGPAIGRAWSPSVQPYLEGAVFDVLVIAGAPANLPVPRGTLLCAPASALRFLVTRSGTPFQVQIPDDCSLNGVSLCTQAFSVAESGPGALTNALDIVIGTF